MGRDDSSADAAGDHLAATIRQKKWELRIPALAIVVSAGIARLESGAGRWRWAFFRCVFAAPARLPSRYLLRPCLR
jgi:hypothetical protein